MLSWLIRAILLTILVNFILRLILPPRRPTSAGQTGRPRSQSFERPGGTLVRDPHCGTYIPVSRAICVGSGAAALYFCSEACRAAYVTAKSASGHAS